MRKEIKRKIASLLIMLQIFSGTVFAITPVGVTLAPLPIYQFSQGGTPCSGCKLFQYDGGTTTKQNTYTDYTGSIPNANPLILDNNGQGVVYFQTGLTYKLTLSPSTDTDPPSNPYWTEDQLFNNTIVVAPYALAGGTADVLTGTFTVASPILTNGYALLLGIQTPNLTTTPTFAPTLNGVLQTSHVIKKFVNNVEVALVASDLQGNAWLVYDSVNAVWILQNNPSATYLSASSVLPNGTTATTQTIGDSSNKVASDGFVASAIAANAATQIQSISAVAAANAMTITWGGGTLAFRSNSLSNGAITSLTSTGNTLTIPAGATLGTINAVSSTIAIIELYSVGTSGIAETAVINTVSCVDIGETGVISTTAISTGATSPSTFYSLYARTAVPYRLIGYAQFNEGTAGDWATAPYQVQGCGGMSCIGIATGLGVAQNYYFFGSTRSAGVTYYNTSTSKPILALLAPGANGALYVNGINVSNSSMGTGVPFSVVIPPGYGYSVNSIYNNYWAEMR